MTEEAPLIVGIGGTAFTGSSTEIALRLALDAAAAKGTRIRLIGGEALLALPHYRGAAGDGADGAGLVEAVRAASGIVIASPAYHGSVSGLVKNAIDYLEATSRDARAYLDGLPVGLIVTAHGWQGGGPTLAAMRAMVHALRGWPTPLGVMLNTASGLFENGECIDAAARDQIALMGGQVADFAWMHDSMRAAA
jgi:FMN reductase